MAANWWYRRGGLGTMMLAEVEALEAAGHVIVPFAAAHPDNLPTPYARYFPAFVETFDAGRGLGPVDRVKAVADLIYDRDAAERFDALLDDVQPDIVHLHNTARQLSPSILRVARHRGVPAVMTIHDYGVVCPQGLLLRGGTTPCLAPNCQRGNVLHAVASRCVKDLVVASGVAAVETAIHRAFGSYLRSVAALMVPSQFLARILFESGVSGKRIRLLDNAVPDSPSPGPIPTHGGHLLYQGRLTPEKGLGRLLLAAAQVPEVPVAIAGDGLLRSALQGSAPQRPVPRRPWSGPVGRMRGGIGRRGLAILLVRERPTSRYRIAPRWAASHRHRNRRPTRAVDRWRRCSCAGRGRRRPGGCYARPVEQPRSRPVTRPGSSGRI